MAQTVVPMMAYEDAAAAIDWLTRAFGFEEVKEERYTEEDGRVTHAELRVGEDDSIFVANPTPDYVSPKRHREECEAAAAGRASLGRRRTAGVRRRRQGPLRAR